MRFPLSTLLVGAALLTFTSCLTDFDQKVLQLDKLFSEQGPTINVLQAYEEIIRTAKSSSSNTNSLPKLLFKKAIIEINLNKEIQAIADLKWALELDPAMGPAKDKIVQLLMARGEFDTVQQYLTKDNDKDIYHTIDKINQDIKTSKQLIEKHEYQQCANILNEIMSLSPTNYEITELYYNLALNSYKQTPDSQLKYLGEMLPVNKVIIQTAKNLIDINPMKSLKYFNVLSQFLLYTEVQFENSNKIIKNCLRIDNEYTLCGKLSKFYVKFQNFFKLLEDYSIIQGHYYTNSENNVKLEDEGLINPVIDYQFVIKFLFVDDLQVSKLDKRKLPSSIKNNYDYLQYQIQKFGEELGFETSSKILFLQDLNRLVCEAYSLTGSSKKAKQFCDSFDDSDNLFLPKHITEIDKYLLKKKYPQAEELLNMFNNNVKQTKLFTDRWAKVEEYHMKLNQQRQQQYFQQQQQQQQQRQRQQQYRGAPPHQQRKKPANDYYKVLDVPRDADEKTIKKGYRTQTLKYHPDKYKGDDLTPEQIEKKMQAINQAYEVLSDPELRERYDRGDDPNDPMGQSHPQWQPQGGGGQPNFNFNFGGGGGGGNQFFQQFFGGQGFKFNGQGNPFGNSHQKVKITKNKKKNRSRKQ